MRRKWRHGHPISLPHFELIFLSLWIFRLLKISEDGILGEYFEKWIKMEAAFICTFQRRHLTPGIFARRRRFSWLHNVVGGSEEKQRRRASYLLKGRKEGKKRKEKKRKEK